MFESIALKERRPNFKCVWSRWKMCAYALKLIQIDAITFQEEVFGSKEA